MICLAIFWPYFTLICDLAPKNNVKCFFVLDLKIFNKDIKKVVITEIKHILKFNEHSENSDNMFY